MIARLFNPDTDVAGVDELLYVGHKSIAQSKRDFIYVTEDQCCDAHHKISGVMAARPGLWVHELRLLPGTLARERARLLTERGIHHARGLGYRDVLFVADENNAAMLRFLRELPYDLTEQPPARIFRLLLPEPLGGFDGVERQRGNGQTSEAQAGG